MNKNRIRLTESQLHKVISESVKRVLREASEKKQVYTIEAFNVTADEGVDYMPFTSTLYYDETEAIDNARKCANNLATEDDVYMVTVLAGESELPSGDIFGEPYDIYTISNKDKATTMAARQQSGYVNSEVDEYVGICSESRLNGIIRESVKRVLSEVRGWSLEPDDFVIIGGKLDPNKTYMLIKISNDGGLMIPYVVEYDEYFPNMLKKIYDEVGENDTFHDMSDYNDYVNSIMEEEGCDEEEAEKMASDAWLPCWDYGFAVYSPYGESNSQPMSGAEMQKNIEGTAKHNWMKS